MASADDIVVVILLASAAFFVALSFGLLVRYRQVSQKISESSDLGRDLWQALEQRLKKQDERILDMMGRLEVIQSRVMAAAVSQVPAQLAPTSATPTPSPPAERPLGVTEFSSLVQQPESRIESQPSQGLGEVMLDATQLAAIRLLSESPKNTRQLTDSLGRSREHTARLMKDLFELGLVRRNDSTKPFIYQLSDEGRRYLS